MKEIRQFLDAMAEARSLADVNIAAGSALPAVSKIVRRVVAIVAIAMLVTTAALAHSYTRLDHRLEQANAQHSVQIRRITTTTKEQQRVMVATIVQVTKQRQQLADTISRLRTKVVQATSQPGTVVASHSQNGVLLAAPADVSTASTATEISKTVTPESAPPVEPSATSEQPAEPAPTPPAAPPVVSSPPPPPPVSPPPASPPPPPPPPPPPAAPSTPTVAGIQPPGVGTEPPAQPVGEPAGPEPAPDPEPPSAGLGVP